MEFSIKRDKSVKVGERTWIGEDGKERHIEVYCSPDQEEEIRKVNGFKKRKNKIWKK